MPIPNRAIASLRPLEHNNLPRPGRFLLNRAQACGGGGGEDGLRGMHVEAEAGAGEPHDKVHHLLTRAHVPRAGREAPRHEGARVPRGGGDEPGMSRWQQITTRISTIRLLGKSSGECLG